MVVVGWLRTRSSGSFVPRLWSHFRTSRKISHTKDLVVQDSVLVVDVLSAPILLLFEALLLAKGSSHSHCNSISYLSNEQKMFSSSLRMTAAAATARRLSGGKMSLARRFLSTPPLTEALQELHLLFNTQITHEFNASQLYLSASIWFSEQELTGMAAYCLTESTEERNHALEMIHFGLKRDVPVTLQALPTPHAHWESIEALWVDLLEAEKTNSAALYTLANAAQACQDHALLTFLQPFHLEQTDAVSNLKTLVAKVREEAHSPGLIRQLDTELERTSTKANSGGGGAV